MADLVINSAAVLASNQAEIRREYTFGATIGAGQHVYLDGNNRWQQFDSDAGTGAGANITDLRGIALNNGANGQPAAVCVKDPNFTLGNTLPANTPIYGSKNAGAITQDVPATGNYPVVLGVPRSTTTFNLNPTAGGFAI